MELRIPHMIHLFNVFCENKYSDNCAKVELGALPSSRSWREGKGREKEKEGRGRPPSPIRTSTWGGVRPPFEAFLSFPVWPIKAQYEFP